MHVQIWVSACPSLSLLPPLPQVPDLSPCSHSQLRHCRTSHPLSNKPCKQITTTFLAHPPPSPILLLHKYLTSLLSSSSAETLQSGVILAVNPLLWTTSSGTSRLPFCRASSLLAVFSKSNETVLPCWCPLL